MKPRCSVRDTEVNRSGLEVREEAGWSTEERDTSGRWGTRASSTAVRCGVITLIEIVVKGSVMTGVGPTGGATVGTA